MGKPLAKERRDTRLRFEQWARNPSCRATPVSVVHNVCAARAAQAEREAVATALDPTLERDRLEPLVTRWREDPAVAPQIHQVLAAELERRFRLTCEAVEVLRSDPRRENRGLRVLLDRASREQWDQHVRVEQLLEEDPGARVVPSPETDRFPAAAAARYLTHVACAEERQAALLEDDEELLAEVIAGGDGFRGEIVDVRDTGNGRAVRPIWVVEAPAGPLRLREESRVCQADLPGRTGRLLTLEEQDGRRRFEVEITGLKTNRTCEGPPPASRAWIGQTVAFIGKPAADLSFTKSFAVWSREGPGAWLTHRDPTARPDPVLEGAT